MIGASDGSTTDYSLSLPVTIRDTWVSLDLATATLNWQSFNYQTGRSIASGTSTLSNFVTAHSGLALEDLSFEPVKGCSPTVYYLDNIHYAAGMTDTTIDFEAPVTDLFVNGSHPTSALSGSVVTLSATLTSAAQPFTTGQTVQLWAKGSGSSSYRLLKTLTTDVTTGVVSCRVALSSTTSYQWRYPAVGNSYAPVNASAFTVISRQRVSINSRPTSVSYRGTAVIKGRITPNRAGVTVNMARIVSGRRVFVASARTTTGGYFIIRAPMTVGGTYGYTTTAAAYRGEAAGVSSTFTIATR